MADEDETIAPADDTSVSGKDDGVVVIEKDDDEDVIPAERGIEDLKKSLEAERLAAAEERRMRAEAEKRAYEAQVEAHRQTQNAAAAHYQSLKDGISFSKGRESQLIEAWKEAKAMGDYQKEVELQREVYQQQMILERLEAEKARMERMAQNPPQPVAPPPQNPESMIDQWVSGLPPRTKNWVQRNRDYLELEDPAYQNRIKAAHFAALADGFTHESDGYFEAVEERLGLRKAPKRRAADDEDEAEDRSSRRSVAPPSAPVSRGGDRKGTYRLSEAEKEAAQVSGLSYEEYAKNKMRIAKEMAAGGRR